MINDSIATRVFTAADQARFADASGDRNPMHVDALAARRTQAGAAVVHGVHGVLWAIDALAERGLLAQPIAHVDASFRRFVYVDAPCQLRCTPSARGLRLQVASEGLARADIELRYEAPPKDAGVAVYGAALVDAGPVHDIELAAINGLRGRLAPGDAAECARLFPAAAEWLGAATVADMALLSTLVGMVCPGLHSIFDRFGVTLRPDAAADPGVAFAVTEVDDRFRRLEMNVTAQTLHGRVDAFVRFPPVEQPALADAAKLVRAGEFSGVSALVIGGSRGIGAATARLIAAGGGRVAVTYRSGQADAEALCAEIGPERALAIPYDTARDAREQLGALSWDIDQMYYFATPQIFRERPEIYARDRFAGLCEVYVDAFDRLVRVLAASQRKLAVFYPSSVFVTERPRKMTEYAMAKAAAEVLCADLERSMKGVRIVVERLPRILTDQTASVVPVETAGAFESMLPAVRRMAASIGSV